MKHKNKIKYKRFKNAKEMLFTILSDEDLYNPITEEYVFAYNADSSICCYNNIDEEKAKELSELSQMYDEYWGGFLGPGGKIYDSNFYEYAKENGYSALEALSNKKQLEMHHTGENLDWCKKRFHLNGWVNTEYYQTLI